MNRPEAEGLVKTLSRSGGGVVAGIGEQEMPAIFVCMVPRMFGLM